jgi:hypothetical protein
MCKPDSPNRPLDLLFLKPHARLNGNASIHHSSNEVPSAGEAHAVSRVWRTA